MRQQFFDGLKKKIENDASKNLHKNETKSTKTEVKNEWKFEENRTKHKQNRNLQEQFLKITRVKIATKCNENLTKRK